MKKHFNLIGNIAHYFIGFTLAYWLINFTNITTFNDYNWLLGFIGGGLIGIFSGGAWELFEDKIFKINPNKEDALRTCVGGILGGVLAGHVKDITFIVYYCKYACVLFVVVYIVILIKNKGK